MARKPKTPKSNPIGPDMTWQLAVMPLTGMRVKDKGKIVEPIGCFVAGASTGLALEVGIGLPTEGQAELAWKSIEKCQSRMGGNPAVIQTRDQELAVLLRPRLDAIGVRIEIAEDMPALDELIADFRKDMLPPEIPDWLKAPGMDINRLRGFADAAARFYKAAPWRKLTDADLIQIDSPPPPWKGMHCFVVMGNGGQTFGLASFPSRKVFERMMEAADPSKVITSAEAMSMIYSTADEVPPIDAKLWLDEHLPLANDDAYPLIMRQPARRAEERLDGKCVTYLEGFCRAIAQSTESQLDDGRWEQTVQTADGRMTFKLSLPYLLEDLSSSASGRPPTMDELFHRMGEMMFGGAAGETEMVAPAREAQELCYRAMESQGRKRLQYAQKALDLDPDCADAWNIMAEASGHDRAAALEMYRKAADAGRRRLGDKPFQEPGYPFWLDHETRPYMRARQGYGMALVQLGRKAEAADEFLEMLTLNPGDNQGIREMVAPLLMELGRLEELDRLINGTYAADPSAGLAYLRALLAYKQSGDSPESYRALGAAMRSNKHVLDALAGRARIPPVIPTMYSPGDEDEASMTLYGQAHLWEQDAGALNWLKQFEQPAPADKRAGGKKRRR